MTRTRGPADLPPLRTDDDVLGRVRMLVGTAVTDRQLWIMFVDGDDRQEPVVVPLSEMPRQPDRCGLTGLTQILGALKRDLATAGGPGGVIFTRERSGDDAVLPLDRAWAKALADACRAADITLRGIYLSTPGDVQRLT